MTDHDAVHAPAGTQWTASLRSRYGSALATLTLAIALVALCLRDLGTAWKPRRTAAGAAA